MKPNRKDYDFNSIYDAVGYGIKMLNHSESQAKEIEQLKDRLDRSLKSNLDLIEIGLNNSKENTKLKEENEYLARSEASSLRIIVDLEHDKFKLKELFKDVSKEYILHGYISPALMNKIDKHID